MRRQLSLRNLHVDVDAVDSPRVEPKNKAGASLTGSGLHVGQRTDRVGLVTSFLECNGCLGRWRKQEESAQAEPRCSVRQRGRDTKVMTLYSHSSATCAEAHEMVRQLSNRKRNEVLHKQHSMSAHTSAWLREDERTSKKIRASQGMC